jgi:hypothetical protein
MLAAPRHTLFRFILDIVDRPTSRQLIQRPALLSLSIAISVDDRWRVRTSTKHAVQNGVLHLCLRHRGFLRQHEAEILNFSKSNSKETMQDGLQEKFALQSATHDDAP